MQSISLKLILRSWWRNKVFAVISILSLAVGIACTDMLVAYAVYELGVETENPEREHIAVVTQDSPMVSGEQITFIYHDVPGVLKANYPEVKDFLRMNWTNMRYLTVGEDRYDPILLATADSSFARFFPYETVYGNLSEALSVPGKIALTEACALRFFGKEDPVGRTLTVTSPQEQFFEGEDGAETVTTYQVAAVLKDYPQSYLRFDALTCNKASFSGGVTFLLTSPAFDKEAFARKVKADNVPTLGTDGGRYYFHSLQDSYFVNRSNRTLLYVGLASALLILLIACFNYINLSLSRTLQQVRMIYLQRVMGAGHGHIYGQLFADTLLTVLVAFLLSLLFTLDLLPLFNRMVEGRLSMSFLFGGQVLPLIVGCILLLSVIPAIYLSRRVTRMSQTDYRMAFTGGGKRRIITALSVAQFAISIGLLFATCTVYRQLGLTKNHGERYRNLIEVGSWMDGDVSRFIEPLAKEIRRYPGIGEVSLSKSSAGSFALRQLVLKKDDGSEEYHSLVQFGGDSLFLKVIRVDVVSGLSVGQALRQYAVPVYISRQYQRIMIPAGENPVGKELRLYDARFGEMEKSGEPPAVIAGVVEDMYTQGMQSEVYPAITYIYPEGPYKLLQIRLNNGHRQEVLDKIKETWNRMSPDAYFTYKDMYAVYMEKNRKTIELSRLLVMYSLISVLLTLSGLFGMALYATEQRIREIGIRKINGATTWQILYLLNRQFFRQIAVAFVLAVPVAWVMLDNWLDSFVYRVQVSWVDALAAGVIVFLFTLLTVSWHSYRAATRNPARAITATSA